MNKWWWPVLAVVVVVVVSLTTWLVVKAVEDDGDTDSADPGPDRSTDETSQSARPSGPTGDVDDPELDLAVSEPREDSYYSYVGNDVVDSLHYDLQLSWDAEAGELAGTATITFRAAQDADEIPLDLGETLEVSEVTLDGQSAEWKHEGKDLAVKSGIEADERYLLTIAYAGQPEPVEAPSRRADLQTVGATVDPAGGLWTLQEPYGAFTWYPVNDQPADKALYDFTITAPDDMVGVANGVLESREDVDGTTVTEFHLDSPASSYLTTLAIGDYDLEEDQTDSGIPLYYWAPTGDDNAMQRLRDTKAAIEWIEDRVGPYPFSSGGGVVIDAISAIETQTLVTYGNDDYALSAPVIVHELVHQWFGNRVSPEDWSDVWLNEGITMYLQAVWEDDAEGTDLDGTIESWRAADPGLRAASGPPGDYDPEAFGDSNIYTSPAVMWHDLRGEIGDKSFWALATKWAERPDRNASRQELFDFLEEETGLELTDWLTQWIEGDTAPDPL